jgi:hypothetical protein
MTMTNASAQFEECADSHHHCHLRSFGPERCVPTTRASTGSRCAPASSCREMPGRKDCHVRVSEPPMPFAKSFPCIRWERKQLPQNCQPAKTYHGFLRIHRGPQLDLYVLGGKANSSRTSGCMKGNAAGGRLDGVMPW